MPKNETSDVQSKKISQKINNQKIIIGKKQKLDSAYKIIFECYQFRFVLLCTFRSREIKTAKLFSDCRCVAKRSTLRYTTTRRQVSIAAVSAAVAVIFSVLLTLIAVGLVDAMQIFASVLLVARDVKFIKRKFMFLFEIIIFSFFLNYSLVEQGGNAGIFLVYRKSIFKKILFEKVCVTELLRLIM